MPRLSELLADLAAVALDGDAGVEVRKVSLDSRQVGADTLFCALLGEETDGHRFLAGAVRNGAVAVLSELDRAQGDPDGEAANLVWVRAGNAREALGWIAARLHDQPSHRLKVAAVTGTNGKTTTAFLMHYLMRRAWHRAGLLGTVHADLGDPETKPDASARTTPEAPELQALFARMVDNGCRGVALEASSHALAQHRLTGTAFNVGVFTNLTQDHLDFHHTETAYFEAKAELFEMMARQEPAGGKRPVAVINIDDRWGEKLARRLDGRLRVIRFGQGLRADIRLQGFRIEATGMQVQLHVNGSERLLRLPLLGRFNAYNAAGALGAAIGLGLNVRESIDWLAEAPQVPGRLELIDGGKPRRVFVDYAHTPDALVNVTAALRELPHERLITVFGCGGDRDRGKRPLMAAAAAAGSDFSIVTSDNPRSEDPEQILDQVEPGLGQRPHLRVADRAEAISKAIHGAKPNDIVLIAGKGHEDFQEFAGGRREPFSDQAVARRCLREVEQARVESDREKLKKADEKSRQREERHSGDGERNRDRPGHGERRFDDRARERRPRDDRDRR